MVSIVSNPDPPPRPALEARFARLYAEHGRAVLTYALPRATSADDAADVVAETFLVAWRRLEDVPGGEDARFWLLATARRVVSNQRRGEWRRTRLAERLRDELRTTLAARGGPDEATSGVLRALERLSKDDREVLLLAGWEELSSTQIARVLEVSTPAARTRLHRARSRLRNELAAERASAADGYVERLGFGEG